MSAVPGSFTPGRAARLSALRLREELRLLVRMPDALFFNLLFPVVMYLVFAVAFGRVVFAVGPGGEELDAATVYLPAMLASGVLISGMQTLGIDLATDRHDGTLRRLAATPLPVVSYLAGKFGLVIVTALVQAILLFGIATAGFGVRLPSTPQSWWTLAWVFALGLAASAVLGIAVSRLPRSARSATAVVLPPVLLLQFISGVYLTFSQLPAWLQQVANVFPLRWIASGFRQALQPAWTEVAEPGGTWALGTGAVVLSAWFVVGTALAAWTFRWARVR